MAIAEKDAKILWGRAAGICSNPTCRINLTYDLKEFDAYNVGEMAHVIAQSSAGPRGQQGGGTDTYPNLLLLCPTCHRKIDKAPDNYPADMLLRWKQQHEENVRRLGTEKKFSNAADLKDEIRRISMENYMLWRNVGPDSEISKNDPHSNASKIWIARKLDTIVPNNSKILNMIKSNIELISSEEYAAFLEFKMHADAFELHQYNRIDNYPRFPNSFRKMFLE